MRYTKSCAHARVQAQEKYAHSWGYFQKHKVSFHDMCEKISV